MSTPSSGSKRKSGSAVLDNRPKFDDEAAQEQKIENSAAHPSRKKKKKKAEKYAEFDDSLNSDLGAESKTFKHVGDEIIKKKKSKSSFDSAGSSVGDSKQKKKLKPTTSELKKRASKNKANLESEMDEIDEQAEEFADSTWVKTYHSMFRKLRKIMRATEKQVVDSKKATDIYALMALYNQMREVIADLRSMIDLSQNTQRIIDQVLYPLTRDISNNYVDSIYKTMKSLRVHVDGAKFTELRSELERVMGEHGKYIQAAYEKSSQRLSDLLED